MSLDNIHASMPHAGPTPTAVRRESGGRPGAALGDARQIADSRSADEELVLNVLSRSCCRQDGVLNSVLIRTSFGG